MSAVPNPELLMVSDFVNDTNRNIFLTGKAGTGKTTFLHDITRTSHKRFIVVAPTGVAAINAGGVTIHSFFQLPFHPFVPAEYTTEHSPPNAETKKVLPDYRMTREKINIIRSLDLLIIDEISMVRADTLDAIDAAMRKYKNRHQPFGGVQLLMIGDIQQLAPVAKNEERAIIDRYYDSPFFFSSRALRSTNYITIELKHIYRQSDRVFIDILNKIRDNNIDGKVINELQKRYFPDFDTDNDDGYITLTTHNYQAQELNDAKLARLPGTTHTFRAVIKDDFPETSYPAPGELILKKGAQVMFVRNDMSRDKLFFNGKIGKVVAFADDVIMVKCPDDDNPIRVEMTEWQNMKFTLDEETKEIEETPAGSFTQYPLRLAWAITIHKSQGLTFDRVVIDAHAAFAHGQVYVALSRCRTLEGVVLSKMINRKGIIDDPVVSGFSEEIKHNQPDHRQLEESKKEFRRELLTELFDFNQLLRSTKHSIKVVNEHQQSIARNIGKTLTDTASGITGLIDVSKKFMPQLTYLLDNTSDFDSDMQIQERLTRACEYFSGKLHEAIKEILAGIPVETDNKAVRKAVTEVIENVRKEGVIKSACLESVRSGFVITGYLETRAKAAIVMPRSRKKQDMRVEDTTGEIKYPELFRRLKEWRNDKATETEMPHYVIMHQKTLITLVNTTPQSLAELQRVKGMGKKKSGKYGEELLEIITSFCREKDVGPEQTDHF